MGNTNSKGNSAETAMFLFLKKRATEEILPSWLVLLLKKKKKKVMCKKKKKTQIVQKQLKILIQIVKGVTLVYHRTLN